MPGGKVSSREWEAVWTELKSQGWELRKHGEQRRAHYLLPKHEKSKLPCRIGSYVKHLTAADGTTRAVYRTRGEVMAHIGKRKRPIKKTEGTIQKVAASAKKTTFVLKISTQSSWKAKSPAVSPTLEPDAGPIPMSSKPAAPPPPAACPVCLTEFRSMAPATKVLQLEHCKHFVCHGCLDQKSAGVCPSPGCGQRFVSTRRSRKTTAQNIVPAPLPGSPSKPKPKLKQAQSRTWEDVSITWKSSMFRSMVTELGDGAYLVHYPGCSRKYDEVLSREALQLRAPDWTSGSPNKAVTSPTCSAAKKDQATGKPLPISAQAGLDAEFTSTSAEPSLRRKVSTEKKQAQPKTAKTKRKRKPRAKTPLAGASSGLPDLFSPPSLSGGSLPAWRRRPLPTGLSKHIPCRRRPPPSNISLTESSTDDSSEFEALLQVVDRACSGQYGTAQQNWLSEAV